MLQAILIVINIGCLRAIMIDIIPVLIKFVNLGLGRQDFTTRTLQLNSATRLLRCKPLHNGIKSMRVMLG